MELYNILGQISLEKMNKYSENLLIIWCVHCYHFCCYVHYTSNILKHKKLILWIVRQASKYIKIH